MAGVSVCVPTHAGRGRYAAELIDSLLDAARAAPCDVEIVVVDDAAEPERTALQRHCRKHGARHLHGPRRAGAKRNIAAAHARHPVLLFVDSDCLATESLIAEHVRALAAAPADVAGVVGRTVMTGAARGVWRALEHSRLHNVCFEFGQLYGEVGWGVTCNLAVRRAAFEQLGGFDAATYTACGGEDVDLGFRAVEAGLRWVTAPDAVVHHRREPLGTHRDAIARQFTYGRADLYLTARFPARRVRHANPIALAALSGAAAAAWRPSRRVVPLAAQLPLMAWLIGGLVRDAGADTIYGPRLRNAELGRRRDFGPRLAAAAVDVAFEAGRTWEALRRRRPALALVRFAYIDDPAFVPRSAG